MRGSIRIGAVGGIPIAIHPSWLFVFGLLAWQLAATVLPATSPGWPAPSYWAAGVVTSLVAFGSVLVHELAHSWIAIRNGIAIHGITLFIFGGVSRMAQEPSAPGVELRVALAGPATSLALAAIFAQLGRLATGIPVLAVPAGWLATVNLAIALFNCLPGFPLDGGRVLRALIWRRSGDLARATRTAAMAGEGIGLGLVGLGILAVLHGDMGGLWPILVGWVLHSAAAATFAQSQLAAFLRGVKVEHVMTRDFARVAPTLPLDALVEREVLGRGRRCFLVDRDGYLDGLLTLHEVKAVPRAAWATVTVGEVMRPGAAVATVGPGDDMLVAMQCMDGAGVAQLPVVSGGMLVGVIGREQLVHYLSTRAELGG
jgi:Zn-dependent protease